MKVLQIDYVRALLTYCLKTFRSDNTLFNDNDIFLFSFYEHLLGDDEVNRYVEHYKQLVDQQNRLDTIGVGIVATTDTPSITNLKHAFISPFEWSCGIRVLLGNRDKLLYTTYELIKRLKGKKFDIAELNNGKLVVVGTIANDYGNTTLKIGDFIGETTNSISVSDLLNELNSKGITLPTFALNDYLYAEKNGILTEYIYTANGWTINTDTDIPEHTSFIKNKLDISFDDIKVDEPFTLNANEYCNLTFGGTATLCNESVRLGNDLTKVYASKYKIIMSDNGTSDYTFTANKYELEPMEMPSGSNANTIANQLRSNYLKTNSHTDSTSLSLSYTFLLDIGNELLKQWFNYARYGENNLTNLGAIQQDSITPNIIYEITELYSGWGKIENHTFKVKIVEDISIENTESDTMTIQLTFQLQGGNN